MLLAWTGSRKYITEFILHFEGNFYFEKREEYDSRHVVGRRKGEEEGR
jgi:hypothetical protein